MKTVISVIKQRLKSPVLWVALIGLIYTTVLIPTIDELPDWTTVLGFLSVIFGIANNPCDKKKF